MTALAPDRVNLTALATEKRIESTCVYCGKFICVVGGHFDMPEGAAWVRIRCMDRQCRKWNRLDVATGYSFRDADIAC